MALTEKMDQLTLVDDQDEVRGQSFTIGKLDAGIAVLISDSVHLIEFPSLLLPPNVKPGSVVNISCTRNLALEKSMQDDFSKLQSDILHLFGTETPKPPVLKLRNVTQTSVTLEWEKLELAQTKLINLVLYKNGQRLTNIPNPLVLTSTKLSSLSLDTDYTFHLVLKTTGGTYSSQTLKVRTHTITDTSGIVATIGSIAPPQLLTQTLNSFSAIKARYTDRIQIDTTHFICTSPQGPPPELPNFSGVPPTTVVEYEKAVRMSIPVVRPDWVLACEREGRMVPIAPYYIDATAPPPSSQRQSVPSVNVTQHKSTGSTATLPRSQSQGTTQAIASAQTTTNTEVTRTNSIPVTPPSPIAPVSPPPAPEGQSMTLDEEPERPPESPRSVKRMSQQQGVLAPAGDESEDEFGEVGGAEMRSEEGD